MALHEREAEVASVDGDACVRPRHAPIWNARVEHSRVAEARVADSRVHNHAACIDSRVERQTSVEARRHRSAAEREEGDHQRALHRHSAAGLFNDAVMLRTTERGDSRSDWYAR